MGLTDNILAFLVEHRAELAPARAGAAVLCVGSPDFAVTPRGVEQSGLKTVSPEDARLVSLSPGPEYVRLSQLLTARVFRELGYEEYAELDIADRADLMVDLNYPIAPELADRFDLIWDVGTVEHVMNVCQAVENLVAMTRVGGRIFHTQGIGDQTNAGYWTFSPNWFPSFYEANGFTLDVMELVDRRQHVVPNTEVATKGSLVGSLIPLRYVPSYYARLVRGDLLMRLGRRMPGFERAVILPLRVANRLARHDYERPARPFRKLQRVVDWAVGRLPTSGPDWSVFVIARRLERLPAFRYPIQNVYRAAAPDPGGPDATSAAS